MLPQDQIQFTTLNLIDDIFLFLHGVSFNPIRVFFIRARGLPILSNADNVKPARWRHFPIIRAIRSERA